MKNFHKFLNEYDTHDRGGSSTSESSSGAERLFNIFTSSVVKGGIFANAMGVPLDPDGVSGCCESAEVVGLLQNASVNTRMLMQGYLLR